MIHDAPILRVRRGFPRPTPEILAKFAGIPAGFVVDAMGGSGCMDYRIKPLTPPDAPILGVAITCHAGPSDNLALFGALEAAKPGDFIIACTEGFLGAAITGDLVLGMARNRGVVGFATDGVVRDIVGLLNVGLPCYSMGVTANSPARNGPGTAGLPVIVGGVRVCSGDIIIADRDGVVVVPLEQAEAVLVALEAVKAAEASMEAKVKGGLQVPDQYRALLASGRVEELP